MSTPEQIKKLAFVANGRDDAEAACAQLEAKYSGVPVDEADIIVALGGDGLMLQTLHKCLHTGTPIFGMNYGSIGFLMNPFEKTICMRALPAPNFRFCTRSHASDLR